MTTASRTKTTATTATATTSRFASGTKHPAYAGCFAMEGLRARFEAETEVNMFTVDYGPWAAWFGWGVMLGAFMLAQLERDKFLSAHNRHIGLHEDLPTIFATGIFFPVLAYLFWWLFPEAASMADTLEMIPLAILMVQVGIMGVAAGIIASVLLRRVLP